MEKVRWGIIGVGDVTERKSGGAFTGAPHSRLVAGMRRNADKARDFAKRHGVPKWYDDADALIADPDVDVVYVSTPPDSHKEYTLKVIAAGKPVLCEKPMARNFAECREMVAAAEAARGPLWVAYYRRAVPPPALSWPYPPGPTGGGGRWVEAGCHQIDLVDFYGGPVKEVHGFARNLRDIYPSPDTGSVSFSFESGLVGSGIWADTSGSEVDEMELVGSKGRITFAVSSPTPFTLQDGDGVHVHDIGYPEWPHQPL